MVAHTPCATLRISAKPIVVSCDASPYGIGAVLSHVDSDGLEHPVAFASRKLASAERNYSQLDKEGLALVFAVKKFHKYLSGREFVFTVHHPARVTMAY